MFIGGEWVPSPSGQTYDSVDAMTQQHLTTLQLAGAEDVDRAVRAARRAFQDPAWKDMNAYNRSRLLLEIADLVEDNAEELATLDSRAMGGSMALTRWFAHHAAEVLRYYAGWPTKIFGQSGPSEAGQLTYTLRQPLGVVASIVGWNGPMDALAWKVGAALSTGNTVVFKPADSTSLTALRFAELLEQTSLPAGVVNIVTGSGRVTGEALITHPDIDKIAFTGSTAVGKHIMEVASGRLTRITLELGGKSPFIVYDDADLPAAAKSAAAAFLSGSGEGCVCGTRIFVQKSVREQFADLLATEMKTWNVGDPFHPDTMMGPLASREHYDRVTSYFDVAREDGASIAVGREHGTDDGLFVFPTLFDNVTNDMRIAQEEIFGPVAAIMPFTDTDEVVRLGNDTIYGLAASVWTRDLSRAHRTTSALQAGTVWVNTWGQMTPEQPFGGFKQSGIGRENGYTAIDDYTELQTLIVHL